MKRKFAFLLLGIAACAATSATAGEVLPPNGLEIFVLAGQSNMSGRGVPSDLPQDFAIPSTNIWVYGNDGHWRMAREPVDDSTGQLDTVSLDDAGVSPALAFAKAYRTERPDVRIGLVPCAKGASSLDDWLQPGGRETLTGSCLARLREAHPHGRLAGVLWYQGESDTYSWPAVRSWPDRFKRWVSNFRQAVAVPDLPIIAVVLGQISDTRRQDSRFAYWDKMKETQRAVRVPGLSWVEAEQCPLDEKDGLHLSTRGQLCLGALLAKATRRPK